MTWLVQFAITIILGLLNQVIKNSALKAELQTVLIDVATDIATVYGYTLTPPAIVLPSTSRGLRTSGPVQRF